jgi:hypothetical protein
MAAYKIRIIANACITRYDNGEGTIEEIVASYNLADEDKQRVTSYIALKRSDIVQAA